MCSHLKHNNEVYMHKHGPTYILHLSEQNIRKHIFQIVGEVLVEWQYVLYFIKFFKENESLPHPDKKTKAKT